MDRRNLLLAGGAYALAGSAVVAEVTSAGKKPKSVSTPCHVYNSRAEVLTLTVPIGDDFILTGGYAAPGDGGHAYYRRVGSAPSHPGRFQDASGAHWEFVDAGDGCDVKAFGAIGDGVANDTVAIVAAYQTAGATNSCVVRFPAGRFLCDNVRFDSYNNIEFRGTSKSNNASGGTKIVSSSRTGDFWTIGVVAGNFVRDIGFTSAQVRTSGASLKFEGSQVSGTENLFIERAKHGLELFNTGGMRFKGQTDIRDFNGKGIIANGGQDQYFFSVIMDVEGPEFTPEAGIYTEQHGGSLSFQSIDLIHTHIGYWINPGAGQFVNWQFSDVLQFDTTDWGDGGGVGMLVTPHDGGIAQGFSFNTLWTATATVGLKIKGDAQSDANDFIIANYKGVHNHEAAIELDYCHKVSILNASIVGNSLSEHGAHSAVKIGAHVGQVNFTGGFIGGPFESYPDLMHKHNIEVADGFTGILTLNSVDLRGSTEEPLHLGSSEPALGSRVASCAGFNPVGPSSITVGSSPWSYTAGVTDEVVVLQGAVSLIQITNGGGSPVTWPHDGTLNTISLQPRQTLTVSYSGSAPAGAVTK